MKISADMNLDELAERMGGANEQAAIYMRESLIINGLYDKTEDVPEDEWLELCEDAFIDSEKD